MLNLRGVNMPAYCYDKTYPFEYGKSYVCPGFDVLTGTTWTGDKWLDYWKALGVNCMPLQFTWDALQDQMGTFSSTYAHRMTVFSDTCAAKGIQAIITPHYEMSRLGRIASRVEFMNLWSYLAPMFGPMQPINLMTEPAKLRVESWVDYANDAIAVLRKSGNKGTILVGAGGWSGARSFFETWYGEPSSTALLKVQDPLNKVVFDIHHYMDENASGAYPNGYVAAGVDHVAPIKRVTEWAEKNNKKLFLGEIGVPNTASSKAPLTAVLDVVKSSPAWEGFAYWQAGPWNANDPLTIEPVVDGQGRYVDKEICNWLKPYFQASAPPISDVEKQANWMNAQLDSIKRGLADGSWKK